MVASHKAVLMDACTAPTTALQGSTYNIPQHDSRISLSFSTDVYLTELPRLQAISCLATTMPEQDTATRLRYEPLDRATRPIRIALLDPHFAVIGEDDKVPIVNVCTLNTRCQETGEDRWPPYCALSHACGDQNITEPVVVNGCITRVTTNLRAFLQQAATDLAKKLDGSRVQTALSTQYWTELQLPQHLRGPRSDVYARYWIDALCINQQDNAEKSHQVAHMGAIYSNARRVAVWLGRQKDDSDIAIRFLTYFARFVVMSSQHRKRVKEIHWPKHWDGFSLGEDEGIEGRYKVLFNDIIKCSCMQPVADDLEGRCDDWESDTANTCDPTSSHLLHVVRSRDEPIEPMAGDLNLREEINSTAWVLVARCVYFFDWLRHDDFDQCSRHGPLESIDALLKRSYWRRAWIFRELGLADKEATVIVCGEHTIAMPEFAFACIRSDMQPAMGQLLERAWDVQSVRPDLATLLMEAFTHGSVFATLPQDLVYSVLPLASDSKICGIVLDYDASARDIFTKTAVYFISRVGPLSLRFCRLDRSVIKLPSWVVDWSAHVAVAIEIRELEGPWRYSPIHHIKFACGGTEDFYAQARGELFVMRGIPLATIAVLPEDTQGECQICKIEQEVAVCGGCFSEGRARAWLCTLLADQLDLPRPGSRREATSLDSTEYLPAIQMSSMLLIHQRACAVPSFA
jgi:hypothetical protein